MIKLTFALVYVFASIHSVVNEGDWQFIEQKLLLKTDEIEFTTQHVYSLKQAMNTDYLKDFVFEEFLGSGTYGYVFLAERKGENIALKISFESNAGYQDCRGAFNVVNKIRSGGSVEYLINMEKPITFKLEAEPKKTPNLQNGNKIKNLLNDPSTEERFFCVIPMDEGLAANHLLVSTTTVPTIRNTYRMIGFMIRLLRAFAMLNFNAGVYHADVKPENLLVKYVGKERVMHPVVIDFDLTMIKKETTQHFDGLKYTLGYRSPELTKIVPGGDFEKRDLSKRAIQVNAFDAYIINNEFKEEAYAVGKTMDKILKSHETENIMIMNDPNYLILKGIIADMLKSSIGERISTKTAYKRAMTIDMPDKYIA